MIIILYFRRWKAKDIINLRRASVIILWRKSLLRTVHDAIFSGLSSISSAPKQRCRRNLWWPLQINSTRPVRGFCKATEWLLSLLTPTIDSHRQLQSGLRSSWDRKDLVGREVSKLDLQAIRLQLLSVIIRVWFDWWDRFLFPRSFSAALCTVPPHTLSLSISPWTHACITLPHLPNCSAPPEGALGRWATHDSRCALFPELCRSSLHDVGAIVTYPHLHEIHVLAPPAICRSRLDRRAATAEYSHHLFLFLFSRESGLQLGMHSPVKLMDSICTVLRGGLVWWCHFRNTPYPGISSTWSHDRALYMVMHVGT